MVYLESFQDAQDVAEAAAIIAGDPMLPLMSEADKMAFLELHCSRKSAEREKL